MLGQKILDNMSLAKSGINRPSLVDKANEKQNSQTSFQNKPGSNLDKRTNTISDMSKLVGTSVDETTNNEGYSVHRNELSHLVIPTETSLFIKENNKHSSSSPLASGTKSNNDDSSALRVTSSSNSNNNQDKPMLLPAFSKMFLFG